MKSNLKKILLTSTVFTCLNASFNLVFADATNSGDIETPAPEGYHAHHAENFVEKIKANLLFETIKKQQKEHRDTLQADVALMLGALGRRITLPPKPEDVQAAKNAYDQAKNTYDALSQSSSFTDLDSAPEANPYINFLAANNVISDTTLFYPNNLVTRAESAKLIATAFGYDGSTANASIFTDVTTTNWSANYIKFLVDQGIIDTTSTTFNPNNNTARAIFAMWLAKAMGYTDSSVIANSQFIDVSSFYAPAKYINFLVGKGVIDDKTTSTFRPTANITRAESAIWLAKAMGAPPTISAAKTAMDTAKAKYDDLSAKSTAGAIITPSTTPFTDSATLKKLTNIITAALTADADAINDVEDKHNAKTTSNEVDTADTLLQKANTYQTEIDANSLQTAHEHYRLAYFLMNKLQPWIEKNYYKDPVEVETILKDKIPTHYPDWIDKKVLEKTEKLTLQTGEAVENSVATVNFPIKITADSFETAKVYRYDGQYGTEVQVIPTLAKDGKSATITGLTQYGVYYVAVGGKEYYFTVENKAANEFIYAPEGVVKIDSEPSVGLRALAKDEAKFIPKLTLRKGNAAVDENSFTVSIDDGKTWQKLSAFATNDFLKDNKTVYFKGLGVGDYTFEVASPYPERFSTAKTSFRILPQIIKPTTASINNQPVTTGGTGNTTATATSGGSSSGESTTSTTPTLTYSELQVVNDYDLRATGTVKNIPEDTYNVTIKGETHTMVVNGDETFYVSLAGQSFASGERVTVTITDGTYAGKTFSFNMPTVTIPAITATNGNGIGTLTFGSDVFSGQTPSSITVTDPESGVTLDDQSAVSSKEATFKVTVPNVNGSIDVTTNVSIAGVTFTNVTINVTNTATVSLTVNGALDNTQAEEVGSIDFILSGDVSEGDTIHLNDSANDYTVAAAEDTDLFVSVPTDALIEAFDAATGSSTFTLEFTDTKNNAVGSYELAIKSATMTAANTVQFSDLDPITSYSVSVVTADGTWYTGSTAPINTDVSGNLLFEITDAISSGTYYAFISDSENVVGIGKFEVQGGASTVFDAISITRDAANLVFRTNGPSSDMVTIDNGILTTATQLDEHGAVSVDMAKLLGGPVPLEQGGHELTVTNTTTGGIDNTPLNLEVVGVLFVGSDPVTITITTTDTGTGKIGTGDFTVEVINSSGTQIGSSVDMNINTSGDKTITLPLGLYTGGATYYTIIKDTKGDVVGIGKFEYPNT